MPILFRCAKCHFARTKNSLLKLDKAIFDFSSHNLFGKHRYSTCRQVIWKFPVGVFRLFNGWEKSFDFLSSWQVTMTRARQNALSQTLFVHTRTMNSMYSEYQKPVFFFPCSLFRATAHHLLTIKTWGFFWFRYCSLQTRLIVHQAVRMPTLSALKMDVLILKKSRKPWKWTPPLCKTSLELNWKRGNAIMKILKVFVVLLKEKSQMTFVGVKFYQQLTEFRYLEIWW